MTNPTPEKLKQWKDAAKMYSNNDQRPDWNDLHNSTNRAYLQGRQDEWKECSEEIDKLKERIKYLESKEYKSTPQNNPLHYAQNPPHEDY